MLFYVSYYNRSLASNDILQALYPGEFKGRGAAVMFVVPTNSPLEATRVASMTVSMRKMLGNESTAKLYVYDVGSTIPTTVVSQANINVYSSYKLGPSIWERDNNAAPLV